MDCKEFREVLDSYVDGELSAKSLLAGQTHLKGCIACSRVERQLALLRRSVKHVVNEFEPPSELFARIETINRPGFLKGSGHLATGVRILWQKKIAIPMPGFALFLIAVVTMGIWIISRRPAVPIPPREKPGVKIATASSAPGTWDLSQFDRGERATIEKVRIRNR